MNEASGFCDVQSVLPTGEGVDRVQVAEVPKIGKRVELGEGRGVGS